jgi:methionine-rich copper-binding protein CopC
MTRDATARTATIRPAPNAKRCAMNPPHRRRRRGLDVRTAPRFDRLEARLALSTAGSSVVLVIGSPSSGSGPAVVATDPASGTTLAQAPTSLTITFNRPIVGQFSSGDFRLDRVASDGTPTTIDTGSALAESLGNNPLNLVITPGSGLDSGHYRLYLLGSSPLAGPGGADRMIDDFTIGTPAPAIATATELGSPVSSVATASGSLDLAHDPSAVDDYRVELPQGHFWRLGAEVDAGRIGSALLSTLTVYDAHGNVVSSRDQRVPGFPNDPYMFVGLNPGVYYVGVSGRTGLPPGAAPSGGAFRLQVVADPADAPTKVVSSTLNYADPTEAIPTGVTIQFNGPLDASAMAGSASYLIRLVDASGRAWAADAVAYDVSSSSVTFVFAQALPAGQYSVKLAGKGGLVDLVGKPPVAPGLPGGTFATFTVAPTSVTRGPGDYGPVFLNQLKGGLSAKLQLKPGEEVTYRFVLTADCIYDLATTYTGSAPTFTAHVGGASVSLDAGAAAIAQNHVVHLKPGVITLDVKGGKLGTTIDWSFFLETGSYDLLLDNGVGQTSGLGLRLVTPAALDPQAGPSLAGLTTTVDGPAAVPGPATSSPSSAPSSATAATTTGPAPVAQFLASNVGPVGHPSVLDDAVAVVGPVAPGGMTALSSSATGIPQGLGAGFGRAAAAARVMNSGAMRGLVEVPEPLASGPDLESVPATALADLPPLPEAEAPEAAAAGDAPGAGLVDRVSAMLAGLMPSGRHESARPVSASRDEVALADVAGAPSPAVPAGEEAVESADLSSPLGLGMLVVAAAHYHRRVGTWLGRRKAPLVARYGAVPSGPRRPIV